MPLGNHLGHIHRRADGHRREDPFGLLAIGVVGLHLVRPTEALVGDHCSAGCQGCLPAHFGPLGPHLGDGSDRDRLAYRVGHLGCHGSTPDHLVDPGL